MITALLVGFALGWLSSVPVAGPIAALVVTRAIDGRFRAAGWVAVGSAVTEAVYAFLAFFGFSAFLTSYPVIKPISNGAGAVVLLALGVTFVRRSPTPPKARSVPEDRDSAFGNFALGAWICAINPTLIATWTAATTTLYASGIVSVTGEHAAPFALGAALGITSWFLILVALLRRYRERFSHAALTRVIRVIGAVLILLALWFVYSFVAYFLG